MSTDLGHLRDLLAAAIAHKDRMEGIPQGLCICRDCRAFKEAAMKHLPALLVAVEDAQRRQYLLCSEVRNVTTLGLPQEGIVFVCQEHGVQPFGALLHPLKSSLQTIQEAGIQLGCGCTFSVYQDGSVGRAN